MRKFYWYLTGYIKKHGLVFMISIVTAVIIFSLLIPLLANKITVKKRYYIGLVGGYSLNNLPVKIKEQISSGLTKAKEDQSIVPLLSERWSVEDEGKTYRFIIKKDITWQDGKELTPEDINYNFNDVSTITTKNDVIFKLPDQFAPFPSVVTEPLIRMISKKYWFFFKRQMPVGIGPYRVVDYKEQANHLKEIVVDSKQERYIYRFYLTENEAVIAFKRGEVDILQDFYNKRDINDWPNVETIAKLETSSYLAVFFNNAHPIFTKNIRQALAYAVDQPDDGSRALGPIDPKSWAYLPGGKAYKKDIARAIERILDGPPAEKMDIELSTTTNFIEEAEEIKKQWEEFGNLASDACQKDEEIDAEQCEFMKIRVNIKVSNFPDTNNYQVLLFSQQSPPDPDQYFLWHSEQPTNFTHYKNTRIDSLLEKGRKIFQEKERLAVYQEFQQFLLEDPPAIFLKHLNNYEIRRK